MKADKTGKEADISVTKQTEGERNLTQSALENSLKRQDEAKREIKSLGENYHPFDLQTGAPLNEDKTKEVLNEPIARLREIVNETQISEKAHKRINKAKRVIKKMTAAILFFFILFTSTFESWIYHQNLSLFFMSN